MTISQALSGAAKNYQAAVKALEFNLEAGMISIEEYHALKSQIAHWEDGV